MIPVETWICFTEIQNLPFHKEKRQDGETKLKKKKKEIKNLNLTYGFAPIGPRDGAGGVRRSPKRVVVSRRAALLKCHCSIVIAQREERESVRSRQSSPATVVGRLWPQQQGSVGSPPVAPTTKKKERVWCLREKDLKLRESRGRV